MKRLIALLTLSFFLFFCTVALANSWGLTGPLLSYVQKHKDYKDYTTCTAFYQKDVSVSAAVMDSRYHHPLLVCTPDGSIVSAATALPQEGHVHRDMPSLTCTDDSITLSFDHCNESYTFTWFEYRLEEPHFFLTHAELPDLTLDVDPELFSSMIVQETGLRWRTRFPISLEEFNFGLFPRSEDEIIARNRLMVASSPLQEFLHRWVKADKKAKNTAVWSAPDEKSFRAANGKASVSPKDGVWYMGGCDGWDMIEYEVSLRTHRIGWIKTGQLPDAWPDPWSELPCEVVSGSYMTDDPFVSQFHTFDTDSLSGFRALGLLTPFYAYVEAEKEDGQIVRGFIPARDVTIPDETMSPAGAPMMKTDVPDENGHAFALWQDRNGFNYPLFEITEMLEGEEHRVTAVAGRFSRIVTNIENDGTIISDENFAFPLSADFHASMIESLCSGDVMENVPTDDLYAWYIHAYMDDQPLEDGSLELWFVTTRIELNDAGEISYMEYVYVPWG